MATGAFAGLVDGFTRGYGLSRQWGREDARDAEDKKAREEERAYRNEQRDRQRLDQAEQDAVRDALKGVKRSVPTYGGSIEDSDMYGPLAGDLQTTQRSQRDILADQARAVAGVGGLRGAQLGLQFQQGVDTLDETQRQRRRQDLSDVQAGIDRDRTRKLGDLQFSNAEIANRQALAKQSWQRAGLMFSRGDLGGALQTLGQGYETYPDGRKLVATKDGRFGLVTPDNKWVEPPVPINKENVEAALSHAQRFLDPSAWAQFQGVRQGDQKITNDSTYQQGMLGIYGARNALDREEFNAKSRGGIFTRPPPEPKEPRAPRIIKGADGTQTALDSNNKPLYNILDGGIEAPIGLTNSAWESIKRSATKAGVDVDIAPDKTGRLVVGYIGRDGQAYTTLQEAAAARPVRK